MIRNIFRPKWLLFIVLLIAVIFFIANAFQAPQLRCALVHFSNFKQVSDKIYVSPELDKSTCDSLRLLVTKAIQRNKEFWLTQPEEFTLIFCSYDSELERYTGVKNAQTLSHITPFETYIVLGPRGYNLDIISHEISHSVLFQVVGYKNIAHKIPVWFNEGLALQVDYRKDMMDGQVENNYKTNPEYLDGISDFTNFHTSSWSETRKHYLASRYELKHWLDQNHSKLECFLVGIAEQPDFIKYYSDYTLTTNSSEVN
ncbi:hypothetical protein [Sunxiuqinia indica]|uniref:hypothetical protein n=1 Tax=Sunxiuqinia indica TaxID=2692584 RepID=UPI0013570EEC|nr:hypothetical protein [Sunxiuqinia indica]